MIPEDRLAEAAKLSCQLYTDYLTQNYDPGCQHTFTPEFEKKMKRLKRKADHPFLYQSLRRVAAITLALLIGGCAWLAADVDVRAAFVGWIKERYDIFFVYRYNGDSSVKVSNELPADKPTWIPNGYTITEEIDTETRKILIYQNEMGQLLNVMCCYDPNGTGIFVNAADGEITSATVQEYNADLILFDDSSTANAILWTDQNDNAFYISAFLDKDGLLKIANSMYEN